MDETEVGTTDGHFDALAGFMQDAMTGEAIPLIMEHVYELRPPAPSFFLDMMREMIDHSGGATGCVMFGTADNMAGMIPHRGDAIEALVGICALRSTDLFGKVVHVAIGADTYHEGVDALLAVCVAPDGPTYCTVQTYTRTDEGVVWGSIESLPLDHATAGDLPRLMRMLTAL